MKFKNLGRYTGILLIFTGIIHCLVAIYSFINIYRQIFYDGFINSIRTDTNRRLAVWFILCGIFLIIFGKILDFYIKKSKEPAPIFLGYSMLLLSIGGCILIPLSGFWLFIPQAIIIIVANKT